MPPPPYVSSSTQGRGQPLRPPTGINASPPPALWKLPTHRPSTLTASVRGPSRWKASPPNDSSGSSSSPTSHTHHRRRLLRTLRDLRFKNILWEFRLDQADHRATQPRHEVRYHIVTHGPPATSRCRPLAPDRCRSAKAEFDYMMQLGIIRPSSSQWAALCICGLSNDVTRGLEGVFAYIDDILVASASEADHARHLRALFGRLQEAGVVINPGKCLYGAASLFPRHTVTSQGITSTGEAPQALHALITPNRASRNTKIKWTPPTNEAFEACKEPWPPHPAEHPLPEAPLNIAVDASTLPSRCPPATHDTVPSEGNSWQRTRVRHFQPYMEAKEFHILTDHKPLTFALHSRTAANPLARSATWTTSHSSRRTSITSGARTTRSPMPSRGLP
ncbi:hypothetical protein C7M84_016118 [Penaeus vannamei]|uniref:Reverse transcriptase domain-containing protein n=1 Tax=Penaeus vannamei TaxID=6689 RepID=A0A423SNX0_PENVA|nr:hypothetical protein C7M84_016118 [Penaeus vannamei]